ncbi:MAG: hypothetical protein IJ125_05040 [Atopobiaceae bacterium]|nr:hypothetical protein [Atopobiaceae bacterium]
MAENTIKTADVAAKVADVEFVRAFNEDTRKLSELLGVFKPIKRAPNSALKYYETSGTLESGTVAEAETIPVSKYSRSGQNIASLDWGKWAKETTLEAISAGSYAEAVQETDKQFIKDIQKGIRKQLIDFLKTGTGKDTEGKAITGANLQATLATIWANMEVQFENTDANPINFMNPLDVGDYLATAPITTQTAFGMTYVEKFLGMYDTVFMSDVPKGTIITTPRENLKLYYADAAEAQGFNFYHDRLGYIGVHHDPTYTNMTFQTYAVTALKPFADYLDKIYLATITPTV